MGESKLIAWLGLLSKCLQTSESSHVRCSLRRVIRFRLVWPIYKDRQSLLHSSGVVYQLTCSCGQNYIGQTKRNLITRLNEHRTCEDSEVCKHLLNNPNHAINFDSPKILDRSNHVTKLRIKETLHISKTEPQLNVDNQSLPLYLFNA